MKYTEDAAGYLDTYPYEVQRGTTCICGKKIPKGTLAVMSVTEPRGNSPWYHHRIVCRFECAIQVQLETALYWEKERAKGVVD